MCTISFKIIIYVIWKHHVNGFVCALIIYFLVFRYWIFNPPTDPGSSVTSAGSASYYFGVQYNSLLLFLPKGLRRFFRFFYNKIPHLHTLYWLIALSSANTYVFIYTLIIRHFPDAGWFTISLVTAPAAGIASTFGIAVYYYVLNLLFTRNFRTSTTNSLTFLFCLLSWLLYYTIIAILNYDDILIKYFTNIVTHQDHAVLNGPFQRQNEETLFNLLCLNQNMLTILITIR